MNVSYVGHISSFSLPFLSSLCLFFFLRLIKFFKVNMPQFVTDLQEVLYYQLAVRKARSSNRRRTNVGVSRLSEDDDKMVTTLFNMIDRYEWRMFVYLSVCLCAYSSPRPPPVSRFPFSSLPLTTLIPVLSLHVYFVAYLYAQRRKR